MLQTCALLHRIVRYDKSIRKASEKNAMSEKLLLIGVGGEGCRMMERMSKVPIARDRCSFLAIDTDSNSLEKAFGDQKLLIGSRVS